MPAPQSDGPDPWITKLQSLRTWSRGGQRAPHKPLLLLLAFGRLQQFGQAELPFAETAEPLERLLQEFGPPRGNHHPEYPFFHLASDDDLWEYHGPPAPPHRSSPPRSQLVAASASGRLGPDFTKALTAGHGDLLRMAAHTLLDGCFPDSIHEDICEAVGLNLETAAVAIKKVRDRAFRAAVLLAYENRCAVCGYEGRVASGPIGLEAAHVWWWTYGGPDSVANGLCLCALHHKLLDKGVISVSEDCRLLVSAHFIGHDATSEGMVLKFSGQPIIPPQAGRPTVAPAHSAWHRSQVFRAPYRPLPGAAP